MKDWPVLLCAGRFLQKLNCDILGWCGLGSNNTLCLCSLLLLRSSKGFPDIISLFLIITPWHTWHQWVKWFFPQPSGGRVRTRTQVSRLLAFQPPPRIMQLSGLVTCLMGKDQLTITVVRVRDTYWGDLGEKTPLSCSRLMKLMTYKLVIEKNLIMGWLILWNNLALH